LPNYNCSLPGELDGASLILSFPTTARTLYLVWMASGARSLPLVFAIDESDPSLTLMPLAVRRALDHVGKKLSLSEWQQWPLPVRQQLLRLGAEEQLPSEAIRALVDAENDSLPDIECLGEPNAERPPAIHSELCEAFSTTTWSSLFALERYALVKVCSKGKHERIQDIIKEVLHRISG
jgi:hypothetical protein